MGALLRQPLVHFLALGLLLFVAHGYLNRDTADDPELIVVDERELVEFLQYRDRVFDPAAARRQLATLPARQREHVQTQLIREEVLHREALKLGLEKDDYVIRQRLVQKMEYLLRGFDDADGSPDPDAVVNYYQRHQERYHVQPRATFTHVHVGGLDDGSRERALALLDDLNSGEVPFSDATSHGDRFPYHTNYVERDLDLIGSHFSAEFAAAIRAMTPDPVRWQGPLLSSHGYHLVLLTDREEGGIPPLESVFQRVSEDMRLDRLREGTDAAIQTLVDSYRVEIRDGDEESGRQ